MGLPDIPIARWASYQLDEFKRRTQRELDKLKFETDAQPAPSHAAWVSPNLEPTEPPATFKPLLERPEPSSINPLQHGADAASKFLSATGDTLGALGSQVAERAKGPWDAAVTGGASVDLDRAAANRNAIPGQIASAVKGPWDSLVTGGSSIDLNRAAERRAALQQELTPENIQAGVGRNLGQLGTDLTKIGTDTGLPDAIGRAVAADTAYRTSPSLGGFGEAFESAKQAGGSVLQAGAPVLVAGLEAGARGLGMSREGAHGAANPLDPSLNLPVLGGAGKLMGVEPGARVGVSDLLGNLGPGKFINAVGWASVIGSGIKNPLDPGALVAGGLYGAGRALGARNAARIGEGGRSSLVPETVARDLPVRGQGLEEDARLAVSRTQGASITPEGWLSMDLGRYQPPEITGGETPRGGVFYSPIERAEGYQHAGGTGDEFATGGSQKVAGRTVFKNPLIVADDVRQAGDTLFGPDKAESLRADVDSWVKDNLTSTVDPIEGTRTWRHDPVAGPQLPEILRRWGGNPDDANTILRTLGNSPMSLRLGIQENLMAAAARREGFDAIIDLGGGGGRFGEIFDLRESAQPSPHGDFQIHPEFQGPSDSPSRLNAYHISPKADLANVDPAYQGTGQMGAERARREARPEEWAPYSNWYTDSPASRVEAHRFGGKNLYKAQFEVTNKPGGLIEAGKMGDRSYADVKAEGYSGISYPERGQVHMFDMVEPEHVGPAPRASEFGRKPVIPGDQYFGQTRPEPTHAPVTSLTPDLASHITEETSIAGGGTWQPRNGYAGLAEGEPGFIVGSPPDVNGNRIPSATIDTPDELARFVEVNKQHLDANPDYMIGTWKPAGRSTTVDVVQKFDTLEEALAAGKERGEEAIWDNGSGKEVPATGEPQKAGDLLDLRASKDPATAKAQQLMDWYDARAQEQIPDMKARAVSVAVKSHHLPQDLAEQVYDSAVRQVKDSKIIATGYGEAQIRALLQEGKFTNKFTAAKSPEELAQMTIDTVGRSRIEKKAGDALAHAADFVDREQASIRLAVGEDTTDFVYAFATAGPPMPGTRVPWFYTVWDEAQPRVTSIHHPFGLLSPEYTFHHTSMTHPMRQALWADDVVRGGVREATPSGPRRTSWEGQGTGEPGYTPWLSGPAAEDHMLASNAMVGMTHELADSAALGKLTDPDQIAAAALGTTKSQFQPMSPAFTGKGQGAVEAAGMASAGEQVSKRAESLIIHPTLEGIKAIYIMGPKEMLGAKIPGLNMTRQEAMLALREKIATETGKDVPVYINDFRDNPGKLITDAEVIAGSPIEGGLAPGRAGIRDNYVKAGYPGMGLYSSTNPVKVNGRDRTLFTGPQALEERFHDLMSDGVLTPEMAAQAMGDERPEYLNTIIDNIMSQRQKAVDGTFTPRDIAKTYWITVGSIQATAVDAAKFAEKTGMELPERFTFTNPKTGKVMVRPEEAASAWLFSPEGQAALNDIEQGIVSPSWEEAAAKIRGVFGLNVYKQFGVFGKSSKNNFNNLTQLTGKINAAHGDPAQIDKVIRSMAGVSDAKTPFVAQMLGLGEKPVIDAVELNYWLTGKGDITRETGKGAEFLKDYKAFGQSNSRLRRVVDQRMQEHFGGLIDIKRGDIPPEAAGEVLHHWLWDMAKGVKSEQTGVWDAVKNALTDVPKERGRSNPVPSTTPYLLKQAQLRAATGGATGGVAGYNSDENANPEERLRNTVLGALGGAAAGAASVPAGRRLITKLDAAGKIDPTLYATHPDEKIRVAALMRAAVAELPDNAVVNAPPMVRVLGKLGGKEIRELGDHFNSGLTAGQVRDEVAKIMDNQTYAQTLKEVMFDLVNVSSTRLRRSQELRADIPSGTGPRRALSPIFQLNDVMGPSRDPQTPKDFSAQSVVDNLANELGVEAPDLRILPDKAINAYALVDPYGGRSLLSVTQGTLNQLDPEELTAVLRHEMLHIAHKDVGMDIGLGIGQERSTDPRPSESEATQAGYEGGAARPFEGMEPPPRPIQPRYGPSGRTAGEVEGYASGAQRPFEGMEPPMKPMSPSGGGPGEAEATVRGVRLGQQEAFGGDLQPTYPHDRLPGMLPGTEATESRVSREAVQAGLQPELRDEPYRNLGGNIVQPPSITEGVYRRDPEALKRISDVVPTEYQNQVGDVYDKLVQRKADPREMTKFWNELNQTVSGMAGGKDLGIAGPKTGTLSDFVQEWTYNSMLSGPRTHLVNFLGNTSETAWNLAGDAARYGPTSPTFKGELAGTAEGLRLGWADFLDVAKYGVSEGHAVAGDVPTITRYDNPVLQKLSDIIGPPTRALQGMDALFYRVNYGMIKGREAARGAIRDGFQPGTAEFENRVRDLMVDDKVSSLAHNEARALTYKGRGGDLIKIPLAVQNMKLVGLPVGRLIVPFAETITNIAIRGVEKTPLGLVGVARDLRKGGVYDLARTGAEDLPEHIRPADVRIRDGLMGTALMMSLIPVAMGGNLTAQGPKDGKQREMLQAQGWKPYSIRVGDRWFQYANATGSMALPIGLLASAVEAAQQGEDPADTVAELVRRTFGLAQDMTWLQGLADFSQAGQQPGSAGMRYMTNWATRFLPFGGALNTAAQASDPTMREVDHTDLGQELASRIPVLRQDLPERTDVRGRSMDSTDFLLGALDPTRSSQEHPDTRLQLLSEYDVSIPDFTDTYRGRKLSATAQQRLQRASFTELSQGLPQLRGSAVWANATKAQRSELLRSLVNLSRDRAADQILGPSTPAPSILPSGGLRSLVPPPTL